MTDFSEDEVVSIGKSNTENKPEDPSGMFPTPGYLYRFSTNKEATGEHRNDLKFAGQSPGVKTLVSSRFVDSKYGYNQVQRSLTGHSFEIDDTPGNERILIKHNEGAGIELRPDGGVSISSLKTRVDVTGGDQEIVVEGDANLIYKGNVNMQVTGEFNIDCLDFNLTTKGNKTEIIKGTESKHVSRGSNSTIVGNVANFITKRLTNTILGTHTQNVKGNLENNVEGEVKLFSGSKMNITSSDYINTSSDNITMSANNMTVQGGEGTIGGTGMLFSGKGARFEEGVTAPTFTGDLQGTALQAVTADVTNSQNYAANVTGSASGYAATDTDTPLIVKPTADKITDFLSNMAGGIRRVKIDIDNWIMKSLDKTIKYDNLADNKVDTNLARSKLRDPKNRNNAKFVATLLEEDVICRSFKDPLPPKIGRIIDGASETVIAENFIDPIKPTQAAVYIPRNTKASFLPDPKHNPYNQSDITIATKLTDTMSISKFLGTDDPTNLKHIRDVNVRRQIAAHLYLQTIFLQKIKSDTKEFNGIDLVVTEGLYRPGKFEDPEGINALKVEGRAVVYKAIDTQGHDNASRLFDIATWLKDHAYFDELILSYDSLLCDNANRPIITARLILTMPLLDRSFTGTFKREVTTEYNGNKLSQGELVECIPMEDMTPIPDVTYAPVNDKPGVVFRNMTEIEKQVNPLLISKLEKIAYRFGKTLIVTEGYRPPKNPTTRTKGAGLNSQHVQGNAVDIQTYMFSTSQKSRLLQIAIDEGITGIGIYTPDGANKFGGSSFDGIHFDLRPSKWAWGDNKSWSSLYYYPWAAEVLGKNGYKVA